MVFNHIVINGMTNKCFLWKACRATRTSSFRDWNEHVFFFILRDEVSSPFSYMHANLKYILHTKKLMSHDTVSIFNAVFYDVVEFRFSEGKYENLVIRLKNTALFSLKIFLLFIGSMNMLQRSKCIKNIIDWKKIYKYVAYFK